MKSHFRLSRPSRKLWATLIVATLGYAEASQAAFTSNLFPNDPAHVETSWSANYTSAALNGTNRPATVAVGTAGVNSSGDPVLFNIGLTAASAGGTQTFLTSGGNIYSPTETLTLTLSNTFSFTAVPFETVVLQFRVLGNPLNTAGVLLTPAGGTTGIAPRFTSLSTTGTGMGATLEYAFQYDLTSVGGARNFTIALPGADTSVSYSRAQLDATSLTYNTAVVPEPSSFVAAALGGLVLLFGAKRMRRRIA